MALGSLQYSEARAHVSELRTSAQNMVELLNELKREMDTLESVLKSKGADELYATYKQLEAKVGSYPEKVQDFANFLETSVARYEAVDNNLASQA